MFHCVLLNVPPFFWWRNSLTTSFVAKMLAAKTAMAKKLKMKRLEAWEGPNELGSYASVPAGIISPSMYRDSFCCVAAQSWDISDPFAWGLHPLGRPYEAGNTVLRMIRCGSLYSCESLGLMVSSVASVFFSVKWLLSSRPYSPPNGTLGRRDTC